MILVDFTASTIKIISKWWLRTINSLRLSILDNLLFLHLFIYLFYAICNFIIKNIFRLRIIILGCSPRYFIATSWSLSLKNGTRLNNSRAVPLVCLLLGCYVTFYFFCGHILILILLTSLLILWMHRIQPRNNSTEWPLPTNSSRLWSLAANEEVVTNQIVLVVDHQRLGVVAGLQDRAFELFSYFFLTDHALGGVGLLVNDGLVFLLFAFGVTLRSYLHDASL